MNFLFIFDLNPSTPSPKLLLFKHNYNYLSTTTNYLSDNNYPKSQNMSAFKLSCLVAASILTFISASPCPYGQLAERGELSAAEAAKFFKARADGESKTEHMMGPVEEREVDDRQLDGIIGGILDSLPLGGGLLNGVLQPLTGALVLVDGKRPSIASANMTSSYI